MKQTIQARVNVGWLHPNGEYFDCNDIVELPFGNPSYGLHQAKAEQLVARFYPDVVITDRYLGYQSLLIREGWIRTDYKEMWWNEDEDDLPQPTPHQIKTLYRLWHAPVVMFSKSAAAALIERFNHYLSPEDL